jgi:membrane-associated progesterone receptor component
MPGFEPKTTVQLDPPKDDPISVEELSKMNGMESCVSLTLS